MVHWYNYMAVVFASLNFIQLQTALFNSKWGPAAARALFVAAWIALSLTPYWLD